MGNHTTRHSFSFVFPCVHTFSVDLNSFCFPSLWLPSPADSWRHGYHLIPCPAGTELSLTPVIWRVMWVFIKTTGHVQRGQRWLSFLSSAPSLRQRVTSLRLKIESRARNAFVPSSTLSAQKEKFLRCANLLSGANEGRSLTSYMPVATATPH